MGGLANCSCGTRSLPIHGSPVMASTPDTGSSVSDATLDGDTLSIYGSDHPALIALLGTEAGARDLLNKGHPYLEGQVLWAVRHELARTVEDVLARRIRLLFLDARAAINAAPRVAEIMANELEHDKAWIDRQIDTFTSLAQRYLPSLEHTQ